MVSTRRGKLIEGRGTELEARATYDAIIGKRAEAMLGPPSQHA